jgi:hypothetical protein
MGAWLTSMWLPGYGFQLVDLRSRGLCGLVIDGRHVVYVDCTFAVREPIVTVRDVVLHEVAHVLSGDLSHRSQWRDTAVRIGCVHAPYYLR